MFNIPILYVADGDATGGYGGVTGLHSGYNNTAGRGGMLR